MRRPPSAATGEIIELGRFDIPHVALQRRVRAYLPARRPKRATPRPALFLFDGQNIFDDAGSFAGAWNAHLAVDRYAARRANPPVVIAIDHGHRARIDELTPFRHWIHCICLEICKRIIHCGESKNNRGKVCDSTK